MKQIKENKKLFLVIIVVLLIGTYVYHQRDHTKKLEENTKLHSETLERKVNNLEKGVAAIQEEQKKIGSLLVEVTKPTPYQMYFAEREARIHKGLAEGRYSDYASALRAVEREIANEKNK